MPMPPVMYLVSSFALTPTKTLDTAHADVVAKVQALYLYGDTRGRRPPGLWFRTTLKLGCLDGRLRKLWQAEAPPLPENPEFACNKCVDDKRAWVVYHEGMVDPMVLLLPVTRRLRGARPSNMRRGITS
jgi:hypothetical protein